MRVRTAFVLVGIVGLLSVPVASATHSDNAVVASAKGSVNWIIPLPNPFGGVVENRDLTFHAKSHADGSATGRFHYHQVFQGESFIFDGEVTCMVIYDGNRAKIGGVITASNDPTLPVGVFGWFQVFDNGKGDDDPPDRSSLLGFGDEAANEAFCNSPRLPRFGPWDVNGDIKVKP